MATAPAYTLDREDRDYVIRVSSDVLDEAELTRLLDYLVLESIRKRSQLTEDHAAMLANEVKQAAWERVRHIFEGP
ncbi:hypothetical protein [Longimicrobium sp.]|uniref:hypothetical protein n=1 Tax=Longimicrobium sp. TaxID=2029185 RepID=UPI002BDBF324|nr:hypothetical protein [Longimicrobium sp.]HSU14321.1 hypothetical protein [Longimicrobium sp.]